MVNKTLLFIEKNWIAVILVVLVLIYIINLFMTQGYKPKFEMNNGEQQKKAYKNNNSNNGTSGAVGAASENILSSDNNAQFSSVQNNQIIIPTNSPSCNKGNMGSSSDLLPQDKNSQWAQLAPSSNGGQQNMLYSDQIGMTSQSLRNANLQLRSDPNIPLTSVGPWLNSTIVPPPSMRSVEIV